MSAAIFAMVMTAALLHAVWNALVKGADDKAAMLALIALGHVGPGVVLVAISQPASPAIIPYVIASTVIHWGYYIGLNMAYRVGDLSVVYPVARGLAPLLVSLGAWVWIDETLPVTGWLGIALVSCGILLLAVSAMRGQAGPKALLAAIGVSIAIGAYSLCDGVGVRVSGAPLAYIGWLFVAEICVVSWMVVFRRKRLLALEPRTVAIGISGGVISGAAYGLVVYASAFSPLGAVSALRETSVIFAALIGISWFGEGPRLPRLMAAGIVAAGIVLITAG